MGYEDTLGITAKNQVECVARFLQNSDASFTVIRFASCNPVVNTAFEEALEKFLEENENRD